MNRKSTRIFSMLILLVLQFSSVCVFAKGDFFEQRYRGWLWFEEKERIEDERRQQDMSAIPSKEEAKLVIEARKEALDNARNIMIESAYRPGVTKQDFLQAVEKYRKLEQEMQFAALKVGLAWDETNLLNPDFLDELKYPGNMYGRKKKEELDAIRDVAVLKELATKSELFVFRQEDCGYCQTLEKHLDRFARVYGFKVEAVSPDGSDSPYFKTTHSKELIKSSWSGISTDCVPGCRWRHASLRDRKGISVYRRTGTEYPASCIFVKGGNIKINTGAW